MAEVLNISVISAAYNADQYLRPFVQSVFHSDWVPAELIIADDGSDDNSASSLNELKKEFPSLITILLPKNVGVANARNKAIALASSKYIAIADSDDLLSRTRLKNQFDYLEANPEIDIVGSNCMYFSGGSDNILNESNFPLEHLEIENYFRQARNGILNGTATLKAELLKIHGYQQDKVWAEDYDLFLRLLKNGARFASLKEALMYVRIHRQSATSNIEKETIRKIHNIREELLGIPKNEIEIQKEFKHILEYRKAMLSSNFFERGWHLVKAAWYRPEKVLKRFGL